MLSITPPLLLAHVRLALASIPVQFPGLQGGSSEDAGSTAKDTAKDSVEAFDWSRLSDPAWWQEFGTRLLFEHGPNILAALAIFFVGRIVIRLIVKFLRRLFDSRHMDPTLSGFVLNLLSMLLLALVVIAALERLGVQTTGFAAMLAAAGFAVGLALQGSLSNFAAGVMMVLFRPFRVGDFVEAAGASGTISEIGVFNTRMLTPDNKLVIVPNSSVTGSNITNYSAKDKRRIDLVFGVSYEDDVRAVKSLLERLCREEERVLSDPAPIVAVHEFGESSVNFVCRPWVKTADYWAVRWALHERVKLAFDESGISIPFPQRDLHVIGDVQIGGREEARPR